MAAVSLHTSRGRRPHLHSISWSPNREALRAKPRVSPLVASCSIAANNRLSGFKATSGYFGFMNVLSCFSRKENVVNEFALIDCWLVRSFLKVLKRITCPPGPPGAGDTGSLHAASHDLPCDDLSSQMANQPTHQGSKSDFHNKDPERLKSFRVWDENKVRSFI